MSNSQIKNHLWKTESLFFEGDLYFDKAISLIDLAENEVLLESYIFNLDLVGLRFLNALEAAKNRGVRVLILVDGIGSYNWLTQLRDQCQKRGLHFRVYHPLPFRLQIIKSLSWRKLRRLLFLFRRINKRNHRKVLAVDGEKALLGSFNISQIHSVTTSAESAWRDTGVFLEGPSIGFLRRAFLQAWSKSKFESLSDHSQMLKRKLRHFTAGPIRLNLTMRWRYFLRRDLARRIKQSERRVLITNGYFLPTRSILRSLKKAAQRGIYVALCIPAKSDIWFVKAAAKSLYFKLLKAGVHIYEYQPRVLHAKTLVVDDWATVGSHNLNHRSLTHDLEVEAVLQNPESLAALIEQWDQDVANSHAVTFADLGKFGLLDRLISGFAFWFRFWI